MTASPRVSIIVPLYNDEEFVTAALDSCLAQTLDEIEVLCVDDASTDDTAAIVREYESRDSRVRLIQQPVNLSAFQARRAGIAAARAPYVLFLDGDDELTPRAAQTALAKADSSRADVVGFGVQIVAPQEGFPVRFERALQPRHEKLVAPQIISELFPPGEVANGHLWRYLFKTELLRAAYDQVDDGLTFYRANDLPITFLAIAHANSYASSSERLYRYHFRRGTSGHAIDGVEHFKFLLSGIEPITAIADKVESTAKQSDDPSAILASYESARLHIIGNVLRYCIRDTSGELQQTCLALLRDKVGQVDSVRAAAAFCNEALEPLSIAATTPNTPTKGPKSIALTTAHLDTGGLQSVLLEQAGQLAASGYRVTIIVSRASQRTVPLPPGVSVAQVEGDTLLARLDHWQSICQEHNIDVIIDHHLLYNDRWPWFALAALAVDVPTIGWVHNFALRPIFDKNERTSFIATHARLLQYLVTLSPTDVAFWKMLGVARVVYLPNPLSEMATKALALGTVRHQPSDRVELAWWGRLDRSTKQIDHLINVAQHLKARNLSFRLSIIGPDSSNLTSSQLREEALEAGVGDSIDLVSEMTAAELLQRLSRADLLVSTSYIEGFQLTIVEAQALGMPVAMYDLPWLETVQGNQGIVTTTPGDPVALAEAVMKITTDHARYRELSQAARDFAQARAAINVNDRVIELVSGTLSSDYSPEPSIASSRILVQWLVAYAERNIRGDRHAKRGVVSDIGQLQRDNDRLTRSLRIAKGELRHVFAGPSYRIGRAITFFPRKLKGMAPKALMSSHPTKISHRPSAPPLSRPGSTSNAPSSMDASAVPDVTFVIPVFNSAPWLRDCVTSALSQSGVNVEVIAVNDGSTDESAMILQTLAEDDRRVKVIDQSNSGQSVARNRGLELAKGRYVVYLDSDDYWSKDSLATLVKRADEERLDVVLFDCQVLREGEVDDEIWRWYSTYYQRGHDYTATYRGTELMAAMRQGNDYRPHVGLYMTRTELLRQSGVRFVPGIVHQDNSYTFRLLLAARHAAYTSMSPYSRRIRPGSTITSLSAERSAQGYFAAYLDMSRALQSYDTPDEDVDSVREIMDGVYRSAQKQFSRLTSQEKEALRSSDTRADAQSLFSSLASDTS